jgi:hypothetical protein
MNSNKLRIAEYSLDMMVVNPAIVMIAKRGSGKSWVVRDIAYHFRKIPCGAVLSVTDKLNPFYKFFFPDLFIHHDVSTTFFSAVLARQMAIIAKRDQKKKIGKKVDPRGILIMDDCLAQAGSWKKDKNILEILMNGRHYQLTYLLTMQEPMGVPPNLRLGFDYYFLLREASSINRVKLMTNFASMLSPIDKFEAIFAQCTEDHRVMVVDNRNVSSNVSDQVFWFRAKDRKFSFGSKKFKEMHKKYYDPEFMVREREKLLQEVNPFGRKKKGQDQLNVVLAGSRK